MSNRFIKQTQRDMVHWVCVLMRLETRHVLSFQMCNKVASLAESGHAAGHHRQGELLRKKSEKNTAVQGTERSRKQKTM
jgi:hypothetical protein